jgi:DNA repair protein RecN (Recombination protein N)
MLRFLAIRRLAVLDAVEIEFDLGLNVLTGETGAGKSILVEAVSLLLGGRATPDLVRTGEDTATIEAIFERGGDELVIRREITAQGRSRAFINGALATAGALRELSADLVELHGQHEHETLLDAAAHLGILDAYGDLDAHLAATGAAFAELREAAAELTRIRRTADQRGERLALASFQLAELERAGLRSGELPEDVELAATRQVLANAERVERLCAEGYAALYESDDAVLAGLAGVWRRVSELSALDPGFQPFLDARAGIKSQLEDLAHFLRHYAERIEASPARLQAIEERLALLERLKRKYGPTLQDVVARRDALRQEVAGLEDGDATIAALERAHLAARQRYLSAAAALTEARRRAAAEFVPRLEAALGELALERTRVEVRFADPLPEAAWTAQGLDQAEFFFSPNPGEELRPLARIASGGELSRVMLAIKTLVATSKVAAAGGGGRPSAPGLIFDEIDAGIGGRVADVVGRRLQALGSTFQVLCITHLPQIAAYADSHFLIEKRIEGGRTRTTVTRLEGETRVEEIGRMLGGEGVTATVRSTAQEMLRARAASANTEAPGAKAKERKRKPGPDRGRLWTSKP